ncbi:MAG: hypothetical protein ACFHXK_12075 [bacterium]
MSGPYPWHDELLERLTQLRDNNKLPNTLALTAPPGWGHRQLLRDVAGMLLETPLPEKELEFAHPDFRWIEPDGAEIKIAEIRRVTEFAVQTAQIAPRKVAAIYDAHLLNRAAANALLKTLEEPPPDTHLVLVTPFWSRLMPTVRSRAQRYSQRPDHRAARSWLEQQGLTVADLDYATAGYAPLSALTAAAGSSLDQWLESLPAIDLSAALEQSLSAGAIVWIDRWYRRLLAHLNDAPLSGLHADASAVLTFSDALLSVRRQIDTTNSANQRLLLEALIVRWVALLRRTGG